MRSLGTVFLLFTLTACAGPLVYAPKGLTNPIGFSSREIQPDVYDIKAHFLTQDISLDVVQRRAAELAVEKHKHAFLILNASQETGYNSSSGLAHYSIIQMRVKLLAASDVDPTAVGRMYRAEDVLKETQYLVERHSRELVKNGKVGP